MSRIYIRNMKPKTALTIMAVFFFIFYIMPQAIFFPLNLLSYNEEKYPIKIAYIDEGYVTTDTYFKNTEYLEENLQKIEESLGFPVYIYAANSGNGLTKQGTNLFLADFYLDQFYDESHLIIAYWDDLDYWNWEIGYDLSNYVTDDDVEKMIKCIKNNKDNNSNEDAFIKGLQEYVNSANDIDYTEPELISSGICCCIWLITIIYLVTKLHKVNNNKKTFTNDKYENTYDSDNSGISDQLKKLKDMYDNKE